MRYDELFVFAKSKAEMKRVDFFLYELLIFLLILVWGNCYVLYTTACCIAGLIPFCIHVYVRIKGTVQQDGSGHN